jgi:hypothetical protein
LLLVVAVCIREPYVLCCLLGHAGSVGPLSNARIHSVALASCYGPRALYRFHLQHQ